MLKDEIKSLQNIQLEIALEIKRICEIKNIDYFLKSGSLIGAIRHNGFIPWDDDLDLGMMRNSMDAFIIAFNEIGNENYSLQSMDTDIHYGFDHIKIMKKDTLYLESGNLNNLKMNGIFVDIFPFDKVPSSKIKQFIHKKSTYFFKSALLIRSGYKPYEGRTKVVQARNSIISLFIHLLPRSFYVMMTKLTTRFFNDNETEFVTNFANLYAYKRSIFEGRQDFKFENEVLKGLKNYDEYLTFVYGDYMTIPPKEAQVTNHKLVKIEF